MKKLLLPLVLLFSVIGHSQFVTVDESFTVQELIENILINSPCAETSNYISVTGTDFGEGNGIGAFNANGSDFPYQSGIVLSSGFVSSVPGPNNYPTPTSDGTNAWPGDADLEANTTATGTNNASYIQFDFVPLIDQISFNFLFASEEYDQNFECTFSDAFAFILTDQVTGVVQNLAVLPGTTTPIEATNIHPDVPGGCPAINEEFFDKYNFLPFNDENTAAIELNGQTVSLLAAGTVTIGNAYTIKLVIADESDTAYDSAVFLEAGSFNIGVNLGDDLTIAAGNAPCEGQPLEIGVTGDTTGQIAYQWYLWNPVTMMFVIIPGETTNSLIVTASGTYQIESTFAGSCAATDDILIEFAPQPNAGTPDDLVLCDEFPNDGFAVFDLTLRDVQIINGESNVFLEYYITLADASAGINPILTPAAFTNTIPNYQVIYAKLEEINLGCYDIVPLVLQVDQSPSVTDPVTDYFICDNNGDGLEVFDLTSKDSEILNTLLNVTLTYYTTQADAEAGINPIGVPGAYSSSGEEIWFRVENVAGCVTVRSFNLVLGIVPVYTEVLEFNQCDDDVLDGITAFDLNTQNSVITGGNSNLTVSYYLSQADADGAVNPLVIPYTNTVNPETVYVRVESNTTGCYGSFAMVLNVIAPPDIFMPLPLEYCDTDNDGFGEFILTDADQEVTGGIPTGNLMVTYHYLLEDAQNGVLPLPSPYLNDVPYLQTVYVRLLDQSTGCFSITTLDLVVLDSPQSLIIQPTAMEICDNDGDGIAVFDLTLSEPELLNGLDPLLYTITYFEDINLTIPIANPVAYSNIPPSPQTIYILVEDIANGCQGQTTLLLWVHLPPVIIAPSQIELCDSTEITGPDDELEPFNLDSKIDEITGGNTNILITYYETQADADAGTNPLTSPYINISNPQTVFIRAEDINTGCVVSLGFTLDLVVNPLPSPVTPTPLEACDGNNDGFAEFTLTDKDVEIIGGEPGVVISYHETLLDAQNGVLALTSPYTNTLAYNQIVYARAEYPLPPAGTGTGCYDIVELELIVIPSPEIPVDLADLVMCDDDGFTVFDLTLESSAIYGVQDPSLYTLTYYITQVDAEAGVNAIANPGAFPNTTNPQTIWVRLEDNITFCEQIGSFDLVAELFPTFTTVTPFELCDDDLADGFTAFDLNSQNATITGGDPNLGVTYYTTQADADSATNSLAIPYTNTVNPEMVYVRIEDNTTGCYSTFAMELVVVDRPAIFDPLPLAYCDPDNDGFGEFTLSDADMEVTGGIPLGNLQVTYHILLEDAQNGDFPILDVPYLNVVPFLQTLYVRLYDQSTGCYSLTTLDLVVLDSPQIVQPADLELCDDNGDGIEVFDLTLAAPELLNGLDPALYTITYYVDAALTVPIGNPSAYSSVPPSPQTVYIVVEDIASGCTSEQIVLLWVHSLPVLVPPTPLELCDITEITGPDDGMEPFDLEQATDEITGGNTSITVTYYETQVDADSGTNPLTSPYVNISNPQTVFIRAEDLNTSCVVSTGITLDLVVNPLPSPVTPTPLEVCDVDNDGFSFFMLTDKDLEIIGGEPDVTVSYYETLLDAQDGVFALTSPYMNILTPTQVVYVRAEYSSPPVGTGCYRVVELALIVNPTPVIPLDIAPIVLCDDNGDGFSIFDLTERAGAIYGTQDPLAYTLSYYITQTDADSGTNPIANPTAFLNTTNPQTIWVRLEDNLTGCIKVGQFEIRSEIGPDIFQPNPLSQCDDLGEPNDGISVFDLTQKNDEITGGALGVVVTYYETQADAEADINVIDPDTAYTNLTNPQIIWVRVRDVNTGCFQTGVYLTLRVDANPYPEIPDPIIVCDLTNPNDGQEVFDLTIREAQILDGEAWALTYYESYEEAVDATGAILTPTAYTNISNPQIVYVRATIDSANPASCFEIVELALVVNPLPDGSAGIEPYIICEIPSDGLAIFDLTSKIEEILAGQDPLLYEVSFYLSQGDADVMQNPIQEPDIYQNISNPQTIYVVISDIATGCFVSTQNFEIEEREGAVAITPLDPYAICDTWDQNDGIAQFDLSDPILVDEILGGQDPLVYSLAFYSSPENAAAQVGALPTLYVNTINPQVVYARVTNINSDCYDVAEVILKVELLPEFTLEDSYRLCLDAQGNPLPGDQGDSPPVIDTGMDPSVYIFEWQLGTDVLLGEIGASITATSAGTYTVTVTEIATGCSSEASTVVTVSSPPLVYDATVVTGAFASLHNILATVTEGLGEYEFQLDDGVFQDSGSFVDVAAGNHIITIRDKNGCGSVTVEVGVIDYPQFMTPNGDGYHDTWNIIGIAFGDPTAKIYIFDRYGKLLKQLSPLGEGWDGTYNGKLLPSSDYWFRIEYTENDIKKEFKGHFTLKR